MKVSTEPQAPPVHDVIADLTDTFCQAHLTHEYQLLCRKLAGVLARKRPSPLTRGKPEVWACAIVRVIGWVNFLDGRNEKPHMKMTAIDKRFGVSNYTGQTKSKAIRVMLKIRQFDTNWTLPSQIKDNPMAWMIEVNGFVLDARFLKKEIQEEAFRNGLIPCVPDKRPSGTLHLVMKKDHEKEFTHDDRPAAHDVRDHEDGRKSPESPSA